MTLPANGPRPPYQLAADKIREDIRTGTLRPGDRLPSARELKDELGIANATVHAALRVLKDEGLVYSVQGRGTYIAESNYKPDYTGEFTFDYTPPAWYTQSTGEPQATGESDEEATEPDQPAPAPGGDQASAMTEFLIGLRDQMRAMSAQVTGLKQQVTELESKVQHLEHQSAPEHP
ncbi:SCO5717 family growth-regulating ATPase [Streptomyces sp. RKAG293]|uniref:SCO5717 family growth-regulating ATPase n=1 Tax=Streptomyces sp. RKAG293 TaxID=2893403 RepID=UPI0020332D9A|nr:SCO5717 family growth-regulating ATPase [Streptomyces sp. RKAG293]MCM2420627.1 GntR family transcriptional regulator [Streptomyces sp. RKAG293]